MNRCAYFCWSLAVLVGLASDVSADGVLRVYDYSGGVARASGETFHSARRLESLTLPITLRTGREGRVTILGSAGHVLCLGPSSLLTIESYRHDVLADARYGSGKPVTTPSKFEMSLKRGQLQVAAGDEIQVFVGPRDLDLSKGPINDAAGATTGKPTRLCDPVSVPVEVLTYIRAQDAFLQARTAHAEALPTLKTDAERKLEQAAETLGRAETALPEAFRPRLSRPAYASDETSDPVSNVSSYDVLREYKSLSGIASDSLPDLFHEPPIPEEE